MLPTTNQELEQGTEGADLLHSSKGMNEDLEMLCGVKTKPVHLCWGKRRRGLSLSRWAQGMQATRNDWACPHLVPL